MGRKRTEGHAAVGIDRLLAHPHPPGHGGLFYYLFMPYLKQVKLKIGDKGRN